MWFLSDGINERRSAWYGETGYVSVFTQGNDSPWNPQALFGFQCTMQLFYHSQRKAERGEMSMKEFKCQQNVELLTSLDRAKNVDDIWLRRERALCSIPLSYPGLIP
jgi:hypothetical protein